MDKEHTVTATDPTTDTTAAPGPWCNSCDSYFNLITNTCRCNNR